MAYLDPNILRIPQMPTPVEQMGQAYQLGEFVQKRQEREQQQKDSAWLQEQLKGGANLNTPEGIADLTKKAQGNVSMQTLQMLMKSGQEATERDAKIKTSVAQADLAKIEMGLKKSEAFTNYAAPVMAQYEADKVTVGEQQAKQNFAENWKKQVQAAGQSGMFTPQELQDASGWDFNTVKSRLDTSTHYQKIVTEGLQQQKERQAIETGKAKEAREAEMFPLKKKETQAAIAKHYADINKAQQEAAAGGKPPAGYRWTKDGNLEAIPGGPAEAKSEVARTKELKQLDMATSEMDRLARAANALLTHPGLGGITGLRGAVPDIPMTDAADAEAKRETLQSQVGFSTLQAMRDASKTGGALGQVTEKEMTLLQNNLASLNRKQTKKQFEDNLREIIKWAEDAKDRMRRGVDEQIIKKETSKTISQTGKATDDLESRLSKYRTK